MYIMQWSRPDIYNATCGQARQMAAPREAHGKALQITMRYVATTYHIIVCKAFPYASLGAAICVACPQMALDMSGLDHCIMYMHVAVADRYTVVSFSSIVPLPSPFTRICSATAGFFGVFPSLFSKYSSSSFCTRTGCVNFPSASPLLSS